MIISTNAGLWGYNIGDTIQFTSIKPYRVIVSGRIKHYISAFGEHVIGKEVETAIQEAIQGTLIQINEFTVAPQITPKQDYHTMNGLLNLKKNLKIYKSLLYR